MDKPATLTPSIRLITSSGREGVSRGALDAAIDLKLPHGGVCASGRRSDSDAVPARYKVREHTQHTYEPAERINVRSADATLVVYNGDQLDMDVVVAKELALAASKPCLAVDLLNPDAADVVRSWLVGLAGNVSTLNVAGATERRYHGIQAATRALLGDALKGLVVRDLEADAAPHRSEK